jgi:hypothetical protein
LDQIKCHYSYVFLVAYTNIWVRLKSVDGHPIRGIFKNRHLLNATGRIRDESLINQGGRGLQIFHFCCIHGNEREKSKPCCRTLTFKTFAYTFDFAKFKQCARVILRLQSRTKKKVGQCFFANGYYENIYLFIIVTPVYSTQFCLNLIFTLTLAQKFEIKFNKFALVLFTRKG